MSGRYAASTDVSPERTQAQISELLRRYGAAGFMYGWEGSTAMIRFRLDRYTVRFLLPLPDPTDREFRLTDTGRSRTESSARGAYEQAVRSRWRALLLTIKAKLEAVEVGITTIFEEFAAHIELPDGSTVGPRVQEQIDEAWRQGIAPPRILPEQLFDGPRAIESGS